MGSDDTWLLGTSNENLTISCSSVTPPSRDLRRISEKKLQIRRRELRRYYCLFL